MDPFGYLRRGFGAWIEALKDRRECARMSVPLVAYYWTGGVPQAFEVKVVSPVGAYLVTSDRWRPGTVVRLIFQYSAVFSAGSPGGEEAMQMVRARIVRIGVDGVGVRLVYLNKQERKSFRQFLACAPGRVA